MKSIRDTFEKKDMQSLPRVLFEGRIYVIISEAEADRAVDYLLSQPVLGFDTETRPSFRRGFTHKVSLLQVATKSACFLFRLNRIELPDSVVRLFEDISIVKVGLSLKDDFHNLLKRRQFEPSGFIELQEEVRKLGIKDMSLQKIYANLFGQRISKTQQLTNWEADTLTQSQQLYAATDAWACINIHEEVERLLQTGDYQLLITQKTTDQ